MGIAEKYGYNHPYKDRGNPRTHPDWSKWEKNKYYCKLDGHGYNCDSCRFWKSCIQQLYSFSYMSDFIWHGGRK